MDFAGDAYRMLEAVRAQRPRVHCITNHAAQAFTADVLLAAGAIPSLTLAEEEIESFLSSSSALLVNLGTLDEQRLKAIELAIPLARDLGLPWVLDPVFVERSETRLTLASALLAHGPTAMRGNRAECGALAQGGDERAPLADKQAPVVAMTGQVDVIFGDDRELQLQNGHVYMSQATAIGCALSALIGAFLAVEKDALAAVASALLVWGVAGELAGEKAAGPGTFRPLLLDAVHNIDGADLMERAKVEERIS